RDRGTIRVPAAPDPSSVLLIAKHASLFCRSEVVESQVEPQDVHAGFAEHTRPSPTGILTHERANRILGDPARFRDPRNLQISGLHAYFRIQAAARRGNQINRYLAWGGPWIGLQFILQPLAYRLDK